MHSKRLLWPFTIVIVCVLVMILLAGAYFIRSKSVKTKSSTEVELTENQLLAKKTLDWLDRQRDENGWYFLETVCTTAGDCKTIRKIDGGNQDGLVVTWARFELYKKTGSKDDLEKVKRDINAYSVRFSRKDVDGLWTCKILNEMRQNKDFDGDTILKMEKICWESQYLPVDGIENYEKNRIGYRRKGANFAWEDYNYGSRRLSSYFGYPSDFLARFEWKKDNADLEKAGQYFDYLKKDWNEDSIAQPGDMCLFGISVLDFYKYDKKQENLDLAKTIYEQWLGRQTQVMLPVCALFTADLARTTSEMNYAEELVKMVDKIVSNRNNDEGGNLGFLRFDDGENWGFEKNILENALLIKNLLI